MDWGVRGTFEIYKCAGVKVVMAQGRAGFNNLEFTCLGWWLQDRLEEYEEHGRTIAGPAPPFASFAATGVAGPMVLGQCKAPVESEASKKSREVHQYNQSNPNRVPSHLQSLERSTRESNASSSKDGRTSSSIGMTGRPSSSSMASHYMARPKFVPRVPRTNADAVQSPSPSPEVHPQQWRPRDVGNQHLSPSRGPSNHRLTGAEKSLGVPRDGNEEKGPLMVDRCYGPGVFGDANEPRKKWEALSYNFGARKRADSWVASQHVGTTARYGARTHMVWKWDYAAAPKSSMQVSSEATTADLREYLHHAKGINPKSYRVVIGVRDVWGGSMLLKKAKATDDPIIRLRPRVRGGLKVLENQGCCD